MQKQQFAIASLSILIFLTSSSLVAGQGSCRRVAPLPSFSTKSFAGIWWMYAVSPIGSPITNSPCQHVDYTYVSDNQLNVTEFGVNGSTHPGFGTLEMIANGQFEISLERFNGVREYDMLDVDYNNYVLAYNCLIVSRTPVESLLIYTRTPNPAQSVIDTVLQKNGLSLENFKLTDLQNCQ